MNASYVEQINKHHLVKGGDYKFDSYAKQNVDHLHWLRTCLNRFPLRYIPFSCPWNRPYIPIKSEFNIICLDITTTHWCTFSIDFIHIDNWIYFQCFNVIHSSVNQNMTSSHINKWTIDKTNTTWLELRNTFHLSSLSHNDLRIDSLRLVWAKFPLNIGVSFFVFGKMELIY